MTVLLKKQTKFPAKIKVIRKKDNYSWWAPKYGQGKYYSTTLDDKQYICSFIDNESSNKFKKFIDHYKAVNNRYPNILDENELNNDSDNFEVYIEDEILDLMKERCLLNGVSLIGIVDFDYTFTKNVNFSVFNLNISAIDLLENESTDNDRQIDNLNYLLDF
jgi:hypothetical protein